MANLNNFYQKLKDAQPASKSASGLKKDHFALLQEHLFTVEFIFPTSTNLFRRFSGDVAGNSGIDNTISLSVRSISLPNASTNASEHEINNDFGKVSFPSKGTIIPDTNVITIQFLNSEKNILEHMMFDWIIETKSNVWVYETHPFTRAKIRVNYFDQAGETVIFTYEFHGVFPLAYDTINSNYNPESNIERGATFAFNWFNIDTFPRVDSKKDSGIIIPPLGSQNDHKVNTALESLDEKFNNSTQLNTRSVSNPELEVLSSNFPENSHIDTIQRTPTTIETILENLRKAVRTVSNL